MSRVPQVWYYPKKGDRFKICTNHLELARLIHIEGKTVDAACQIVGIERSSFRKVRNHNAYLAAKKDMLSDADEELHAMARSAQRDILSQRDDLRVLASVAADVRDRKEGRANQRVTVDASLTIHHRLVVPEASPGADAVTLEPVDRGVYALPDDEDED